MIELDLSPPDVSAFTCLICELELEAFYYARVLFFFKFSRCAT